MLRFGRYAPSVIGMATSALLVLLFVVLPVLLGDAGSEIGEQASAGTPAASPVDILTRSRAAIESTATWWKIAASSLVFLGGVWGNILASGLQRRIDEMARRASPEIKNHHLAALVGDTARVILMLLAENDGATASDRDAKVPGVVSTRSRQRLFRIAPFASEYWVDTVTNSDAASLARFDAILEPRLSEYIIKPGVPAGSVEAWGVWLDGLAMFARTKKGLSRPPFPEPEDRLTTAQVLANEFGRVFRETLKHDFGKGGPGWAAFQLEVSAQLLRATTENPSASGELADATRVLADRQAGMRQELLSALTGLGHDQAETRRVLERSLGRVEESLRAIESRLAVIESKLDRMHAPCFVLPTPDTSEARNRYVFRNEVLAVVGRDAEFAELNAWLDDPRPFSWDLWTGKAGAGKSRLALELCRRREDWVSGFMVWQKGRSVHWDTWTPAKPTLIVFDYVAEHAAEIGDAIALLSARSWPTGARVRALLLEREVVRADRTYSSGAGPEQHVGELPLPPWLSTLLAHATAHGGGARAAHARTRIEIPERPLDGVTADAAKEIIRLDVRRSGPDGRSEVSPLDAGEVDRALEVISRIDPERRPLFIAMTAEALRWAGPSIRSAGGGWDLERLVGYINDKETAHWRKRLEEAGHRDAADVARWSRLVLLATAARGLNGPMLAGALRSDAALGLPRATEWGDGAVYALLIGGAHGDYAPPLEPDVLGEAFVLSWLSQNPQEASAMIGRAWTLGMSEFIERAAHSFPDRVGATGLLAPHPNADPDILAAAHIALATRDLIARDSSRLAARCERLLLDPDQPLRVRAFGAVLLTVDPMSDERFGRLSSVTNELLALGSQDASVREFLASALQKAIVHTGTDHDRADALLAQFQAFSMEHSRDAAVREWLAKGLFAAFYNAREKIDRADALLAQLQALSTEHPRDAAVREWLAKGLYSSFFLSSEDHARADRLLTRLEAMATEQPQDVAVREWLAKGLFNAFFHAGTDCDRADRLLARLEDLAKEHPQDAAVREQLATGLINAITGAGTDCDRADRLLARLEAMATEQPQDVAVREWLAKGLTNAIFLTGTDCDRADRLLARLEPMATERPQDVTVREWLAKGLCNAISHADMNHDRGDRLLGRLEELTEEHPQDATVCECLARALVDAILHAGTDHDRADRLLARLEAMANEYLQDVAVREGLAKGLNNAIVSAGTDLNRADRLLARLEELAKEYPQDVAVRECLASGLSNAIYQSDVNHDRADRLLARLEELAKDHLGDGTVRERLVQGLLNASQNARERNVRADGLLARVEAMSKEHPQDSAVRERLAKWLYGAIVQAGTNHDRADRLLARLELLAEEHPQDSVVRKQLAWGLFHVLTNAPEKIDQFDALLARLEGLAKEHPQDAAVREWLAKGLNNAIGLTGTNHDRTDRILTRLEALAKENPQDAAVRECLASGLHNAIVRARANHDRQDRMLARLEGLNSDYLHDAAIRRELAQGLRSAIIDADKNHDRLDLLLARLEALAKAHPKDGVVQGVAVRACMFAFVCAYQGWRVEVRPLTLVVELMPHVSDDPELREQILPQFLGLVTQACERVQGPPKHALGSAGAALWKAYRARFGAG